MAKYSKYQVPRNEPPKDLHPAWRGIGCLLWIIAPLMSYAFAVLLVGAFNKAGMVPSVLLGRIPFPDWSYKAPFLSLIVQFIGSLNNILAILAFFIPMLVVLSGLFSLMYAWLYRVVGPPRYSPMDAPPAGKATKKSR